MTHRYDDNYRRRHGILQGFPQERKFQTREEIDAYFSGDRIQCLLCGKWLKWIAGIHLRQKHGITTDEYKKMFGLPWGRGLTSKTTNKIKGEIAKQRWADGQMDFVRESFFKAKRTAPGSSGPLQKKKPRKSTHIRKKVYERKDYEEILGRMRKEKRVLIDVCKDPDLPSIQTCNLYMQKHPEFAKKAKEIHYRLPYPVQIEHHDVSPRFRIDCERLRTKGMKMVEIAGALEANNNIVRETLRNFHREMGMERIKRSRKWPDEAYEAILERMWKQQRSVWDVCTDPDLPLLTSWKIFVKKHPEFVEKAKKIHHHLPYSVQMKHYVTSPRFRIDCERLRTKGMKMPKIAYALGVSYQSVQILLRNYNKKIGLAPTLPFKSYPQEYYEKILERMRKEQRSLMDVCSDPDLPGIGTWERFVKKHPEFGEEAKKIHYSLPYSVQIRHFEISPRFRIDCERLRAKGMVFQKIADSLGVKYKSVQKQLRNYNGKNVGPSQK